MSLDSVRVRKVRRIGAGLQTDTGTAAELDGDDAKLIAFDPDFQCDDEVIERPNQGGFGLLKSYPGAKRGTATFRTELMGNGASGLPFWATTLLPAIGMGVDGSTYSFTNSTALVTLVEWIDGVKRGLRDARGNCNLIFEPGQPVMLDWSFEGNWIEEESDAVPAATLPTVLPPILTGATVTFGGSHVPRFSRMNIDVGNRVYMRPDATSTTGFRSACITDRMTTGSIDPEAPALASRDWRALIAASTEETLSIVVGSAANNIITIAATSNMQARRSSNAEREGLEIHNIELGFNRASPFTIAFT